MITIDIDTKLSTFNELINRGIIATRLSECGKLVTLKYSRKAAFDKKVWADYGHMMKYCRGHTYDVATGSLIGAPLTKVFHVDEDLGGFKRYERGDDFLLVEGNRFFTADTQVKAYKKFNGYMGWMSFDPNKNDAVIGTTGGACYLTDASKSSNDFLRHLGELVIAENRYPAQDDGYGQLTTYIYEVCDEAFDPHIIKEDFVGLRLIATSTASEHTIEVRQCGLPEFEGLLRDVFEQIKNVKHEGYIVADTIDRPLFKLKSNYYVAAKMIARASQASFNDKLVKALSLCPQLVLEPKFGSVNWKEELMKADEQTRLQILGVK